MTKKKHISPLSKVLISISSFLLINYGKNCNYRWWLGRINFSLLLSEKNEVHLFESSANLGGRARSFKQKDDILDNGSHLLFSGYEFTFKIFNKIQFNINDLYPITISQLLDLHKKKYLLNKKNNFF